MTCLRPMNEFGLSAEAEGDLSNILMQSLPSTVFMCVRESVFVRLYVLA